MNTITELTITRHNWLRGEEDSYLLRMLDQKMCCLGHFSLACGAKREHLVDRTTPYRLTEKFGDSACPIQIYQPEPFDTTNLIHRIMETNDEKAYTDDQREVKLKELFLQLNPPVVLTFVD